MIAGGNFEVVATEVIWVIFVVRETLRSSPRVGSNMYYMENILKTFKHYFNFSPIIS